MKQYKHLKDYTTSIEPDKTAAEIARCLSMHGAKAVLTEYDEKEGFVVALSFQMNINDSNVAFRLPSDWRPVLQILENDNKIPKARSTKEQAVRTAWRIVLHWVEAQMAFIESQQIKTQQAFLPYAVMKNGKTLSEQIISNPNLLLGSGE